jgi:hypothetical protein
MSNPSELQIKPAIDIPQFCFRYPKNDSNNAITAKTMVYRVVTANNGQMVLTNLIMIPFSLMYRYAER